MIPNSEHKSKCAGRQCHVGGKELSVFSHSSCSKAKIALWHKDSELRMSLGIGKALCTPGLSSPLQLYPAVVWGLCGHWHVGVLAILPKAGPCILRSVFNQLQVSTLSMEKVLSCLVPLLLGCLCYLLLSAMCAVCSFPLVHAVPVMWGFISIALLT